MAIVMNEEDKKKMLDELLTDGETYQLTIWGTIMADAKALMLLGGLVGGIAGALSNAYCYIGLTDKHLNFVVVDSIKVNIVRNQICIPLDSITNVKVKNGLLGRTTIHLEIGKSKMKLALVSNTIGTKLLNQKEGVEKLKADLVKYAR